MRFVLTIEAEHSQHVNAINFFFLVAATWNNGGEAANEDKQRDKGLNTKRRERALTIETDYSQHQHVNVIFFFFLVLVATCNNGGGGPANGDKWRDKGLNTKRRERERVRCILLLGLEIRIECNKQGIINEILVGMLALMRVFFFTVGFT